MLHGRIRAHSFTDTQLILKKKSKAKYIGKKNVFLGCISFWHSHTGWRQQLLSRKDTHYHTLLPPSISFLHPSHHTNKRLIRPPNSPLRVCVLGIPHSVSHKSWVGSKVFITVLDSCHSPTPKRLRKTSETKKWRKKVKFPDSGFFYFIPVHKKGK